MKLKNILIVVSDLERSKGFYHDLFGLDVIRDLGGNVILTEGLVLQEKAVWEKLLGKAVSSGDADSLLYFEETDLESFRKKLGQYPGKVRYLETDTHMDEGVIRLYDPDGHLIEVREMEDGRVWKRRQEIKAYSSMREEE